MANFPVTLGTRVLDSLDVEYTKHLYDYTKSGAVAAAELMDLPEHAMIKTLVMEDNEKKPFIILMHGEKRTSLKDLARQIDVKNVSSVSVKDAQRYTGYMVGGISPFGTKRVLKVHVEATILDLDYLYINGGRRGFILGMTPEVLVQALNPVSVSVAR
jgi:Cys-tRNA(Pro) deacylase